MHAGFEVQRRLLCMPSECAGQARARHLVPEVEITPVDRKQRHDELIPRCVPETHEHVHLSLCTMKSPGFNYHDTRLASRSGPRIDQALGLHGQGLQIIRQQFA